METTKELNSKLKAEVNKTLEELFKKIGNNRQQLANKVISFHKEINKELNKAAVDPKRGEEILREVAAIQKMAAKQLPHLERVPVRPAAPPVPPVVKTPEVAKVKTPEPEKVKTASPAKPKAKAAPAPKKAATEKKKKK